MRKRISETNIFPKFNLFEEYQKIEYLISENRIIGGINGLGRRLTPQYTIEDYVGELCFSDWTLRGTFLSIPEMRYGLGIEKAAITAENINDDLILDFLQYAANLCLRAASSIGSYSHIYIADKHYFSMIMGNISMLASRLDAELYTESPVSEIFITYKDPLSSVVAEDHPDIKNSIVEYKKIDNRNDLNRKGEILCTLFKILESVEDNFKGTTYAKLCSDTTFLFNKIGARHWVENDRIASKTFLSMSPAELEQWYDRTFDLFLSCMVVLNYLKIKKDIEAIRQTD